LTTDVVGVVCALQSEARHLGRTVSGHAAVAALEDGTLLSVSGMGGAAAARAARNLVAAGAASLVSWGMAGGLDPSLPAGKILLPGEVAAADGTSIATARRWREHLSAALLWHQPLTGGTLLTSDAAISSVAAKAALFRATGAAAVDMESLYIAQVALAHGLPFIAIRVLIDTAGDAVPDAVRAAADAGGQVRLGRLLGQVLRRPRDVWALARLTRGYRAANRALAEVARSAALAPPASACEPDAGKGGAHVVKLS
jgi:adenosylhomocysteine nucleosidase